MTIHNHPLIIVLRSDNSPSASNPYISQSSPSPSSHETSSLYFPKIENDMIEMNFYLSLFRLFKCQTHLQPKSHSATIPPPPTTRKAIKHSEPINPPPTIQISIRLLSMGFKMEPLEEIDQPLILRLKIKLEEDKYQE